MIPDERSALALAGTIAELIGEADEAETTLAAVADALRTGLDADRVRLWVRATGARSFGAVCSPGAPVPARVASLEALAPLPGDARFVLEHAGIEVGLLEARIAVGHGHCGA